MQLSRAPPGNQTSYIITETIHVATSAIKTAYPSPEHAQIHVVRSSPNRSVTPKQFLYGILTEFVCQHVCNAMLQ